MTQMKQQEPSRDINSGYALTNETLEQYIDQHGMVRLLTLIENICLEKAEHVQTNWQDRTLASAWRRGAKRIYKAAQFEDWPL